MCGVCGCDTEGSMLATQDDHAKQSISIEQAILSENEAYAVKNRKLFSERRITAINVMSSPGSGKTTLLAKTISDLKSELNFLVIVGDQQTDFDAQQLRKAGAPAIQVNTGKVCHLDAHRVGHAIEELELPEKSCLFIENVGNLVCPALFNLGEQFRIVILSVTEGDNKPIKYPEMFRQADLVIFTKLDLLPYVDFNIEFAVEYMRRINPKVQYVQLSASNGEGLSEWYDWLKLNQL